MSKKEKRFKEAGGVIPGDMGPVQILELGIYNEISARDFYLSLAQQIRDASGREKFEFLANDEKRHKKILEDWYKKESGGRDFPFDSKKVKTIKAEVKDHTSAFEAIDLAQEAERQAYLFYQEAAKRTNDEKGKEMFQKLAEEEGHYQKLSAERNAIAGGFYWFGLDQAAPLED